jgi:hypothetical protein
MSSTVLYLLSDLKGQLRGANSGHLLTGMHATLKRLIWTLWQPVLDTMQYNCLWVLLLLLLHGPCSTVSGVSLCVYAPTFVHTPLTWRSNAVVIAIMPTPHLKWLQMPLRGETHADSAAEPNMHLLPQCAAIQHKTSRAQDCSCVDVKRFIGVSACLHCIVAQSQVQVHTTSHRGPMA